MGCEGAVDGGHDFGKDLGMGLEGLVNGAIDERPEFLFFVFSLSSSFG